MSTLIKSESFFNWVSVNRAFNICSKGLYLVIKSKREYQHRMLQETLKDNLLCDCLRRGQELCGMCSQHQCSCTADLKRCSGCQQWSDYIIAGYTIPTLGELYTDASILTRRYLKFRKNGNQLRTDMNMNDIAETLHVIGKYNLFKLTKKDKMYIGYLNETRNKVKHDDCPPEEIQKISLEQKNDIYKKLNDVLNIQVLRNANADVIETCQTKLREWEGRTYAQVIEDSSYQEAIRDAYDSFIAAIDNRIEEVDKNVQHNVLMMVAVLILYLGTVGIMLLYALVWITPVPFSLKGCPDQDKLFLKYGTISNFKDLGDENDREYIYRDIIAKSNQSKGILVLGEVPGLGLSYTMEKLICSTDGIQLTIRENLIGFHICLLDEMNTQQPCNFIENFVIMFSRQLPEYFTYMKKNWDSMHNWRMKCYNDPFGSFTQVLTFPLSTIRSQSTKYIVIDNVDECGTCPRSLLRVLQEKTKDFPSWIKVIYSSNNLPIVTSSFTILERTMISKDDPNHLECIRRMIRRIKGSETLSRDIDDIVNEVDGNFLCLLMALDNSEKKHYSFHKPTYSHCFNEILEKMFDDVFKGHSDKFRKIKPILEVMVATFTPLPKHLYYKIGELSGVSQEEMYSLFTQMNKIIQEKSDGALRFVHKYIYTWLPSETKNHMSYVIKAPEGHVRLAKFVMDYNAQEVSLDNLARHVYFSRSLDLQQKFREKFADEVTSMMSSRWDEILDGTFEHTSSEDLVKLLLFQYKNISLDKLAFAAAVAGDGKVLYTLLQFGANCTFVSSLPVQPITYNFKSYRITLPTINWNMLQVAAMNGTTSVIRVLMEHDKKLVFLHNSLGNAFHIALLFGQKDAIQLMLELDKRLASRGMLMFAVKNRITIGVNLLIQYKAPVDCVPCNESIQWINSQTFSLQHLDVYKFNYHQVLVNQREQDRLVREIRDELWKLTCENLLDIAIYNKDFEMAKLLVKNNSFLTQCYHYTGRLPIVTSVKYQDKRFFSYLLDLEHPMLGECKSFNFYKRQKLIKALCQNPMLSDICLSATVQQASENIRCPFGSQIESAIDHYANDHDFAKIFNHSVWAKGDFVKQEKCSGSMSLFYALCIDTSPIGLYNIKSCKKLLEKKSTVKVMFQETYCRMKPFPLFEHHIECVQTNIEGLDAYLVIRKFHGKKYSNETKVFTINSNVKPITWYSPSFKNCSLSSQRLSVPLKQLRQNSSSLLEWGVSGITFLDFPHDFVLCLQYLALGGKSINFSTGHS